jgi:hypothetical protein
MPSPMPEVEPVTMAVRGMAEAPVLGPCRAAFRARQGQWLGLSRDDDGPLIR